MTDTSTTTNMCTEDVCNKQRKRGPTDTLRPNRELKAQRRTIETTQQTDQTMRWDLCPHTFYFVQPLPLWRRCRPTVHDFDDAGRPAKSPVCRATCGRDVSLVCDVPSVRCVEQSVVGFSSSFSWTWSRWPRRSVVSRERSDTSGVDNGLKTRLTQMVHRWSPVCVRRCDISIVDRGYPVLCAFACASYASWPRWRASVVFANLSTILPVIANMSRGELPMFGNPHCFRTRSPWRSAKDSVIFSGGDNSKDYGADQQRLQISDLHFDKFPTPVTFTCWKIRFKTEVCTCSQFPTEAMQWIKEVELVGSVDEL